MIFNKLDQTAKGKIRPRFKLESSETVEKIINLIQQEKKHDQSIVFVKQNDNNIKISIPKAEQHYWSPALNLSFYPKEVKDKTIIRGQIGPSENVWGLFVLFYAAIAVLGFFASVWAYVQWALNNETIYFIAIPVSIILMLSIFITSKFGQRKAHTQTLHLMRFLRRAIDSIPCERLI